MIFRGHHQTLTFGFKMSSSMALHLLIYIVIIVHQESKDRLTTILQIYCKTMVPLLEGCK